MEDIGEGFSMSSQSIVEIKHFFFDENLSPAITSGVKETLQEMCRLSCDFESGFFAQKWSPVGQASGSVELSSYQQRGRLQLHLSDVATLAIMAKLLGRAPIQVNDEALDCIGALTGIVYGRMKSILNPKGYKFLTAKTTMFYTPSQNHSEESLSHLIIPFRVASSKCFVQVILYA